MFHTPLLRAVNLSIAVLLIASGAATYWYAWRPLGETSGEITAGISGSATISRDALGVPHIRAATMEDAMFLEGYAMAQDRLWQMDGLRRRAAGELAEIAGALAMDGDREARRFRMRHIGEEQERGLSPGDRATLAAFARGVDEYIATHRNRLPLEFTLLRYDPRPWTVADSILAGLEMYRELTPGWRAEINKLHMLEGGDRSKVEFLMPAGGATAPQPGSNAWAISGAHSATGKPILANDPHLEFSIPSPWYLVHLEAPGLNVTGATIAGIPGVVTGHNDRIAWGITNLEFDVQDLYREQIDLNSGRYLYEGHEEQARLERDAIAVKGAPAVSIATWITRHGPVFVGDEGRQYSIRWTAAEEGGVTFPFVDVDRAHNWTEFVGALARYAGPAQNFVYADVDGNIGYHAAGRLPARRKCAGDVPADGSTGECEWDGYIPFDELPQAFNPRSGIIATANQNPFPAAEPGAKDSATSFRVNGNFAPPYRARQIRALLESRPKWRPEEMLRIETDVYSAFHDFLAKQILAAWDHEKNHAKQGAAADAIAELRRWDGQMKKDAAAPMIATLAYLELRKAAAERAAPKAGTLYESIYATAAIERLLTERPPDWFPDYDALLLRSLDAAVQAGMQRQGSKVSRWNYGQFQRLTITHPVEGRLPLIGKYFNIGPAPFGGSPVSVAQYTGRIGPSLRMITDLADLNHSFANLVAGESGQRLSGHYKDQWDAYYARRSFPMQFGKVEAKRVLTVRPR
ncbi:MAG TPA: penicillin acylase family protein [Bryobacteraceae bacterium]|nr:penicillin acylase family protein [Bryobacteraceae bacterium]